MGSSMAAKTSRSDFEEVFPLLADDVLDLAQRYKVPLPAQEWFRKVLPV